MKTLLKDEPTTRVDRILFWTAEKLQHKWPHSDWLLIVWIFVSALWLIPPVAMVVSAPELGLTPREALLSQPWWALAGAGLVLLANVNLIWLLTGNDFSRARRRY